MVMEFKGVQLIVLPFPALVWKLHSQMDLEICKRGGLPKAVTFRMGMCKPSSAHNEKAM